MRRFDRIVVGGFTLAALVAFALGVGTIGYAYMVIEPKLSQVNDELRESLALVERGLHVLDTHPHRLKALYAPQQSTVEASRTLADLLEQAAYLSEHGARTLNRTAHSLREVEDRTGLILPDGAFNSNAEAVATTARSLDALAPRLYDLYEDVDTLAGDFARAAENTGRLEQALTRADVTIAAAESQLTETSRVVRSAELPTEIARLVSVHGGFYILFGMVLLGMAGMWWQVARLRSAL